MDKLSSASNIAKKFPINKWIRFGGPKSEINRKTTSVEIFSLTFILYKNFKLLLSCKQKSFGVLIVKLDFVIKKSEFCNSCGFYGQLDFLKIKNVHSLGQVLWLFFSRGRPEFRKRFSKIVCSSCLSVKFSQNEQ